VNCSLSNSIAFVVSSAQVHSRTFVAVALEPSSSRLAKSLSDTHWFYMAEVAVALIGPGLVGSAFLNQLSGQVLCAVVSLNLYGTTLLTH
jgi:hypothetical protein